MKASKAYLRVGYTWREDPTKDLYPNQRVTREDRQRAADKHLEYHLPRELDVTDRTTKHRLLHKAKLRVRCKLLLATALAQPDLDDGARKAFVKMQQQLADQPYHYLSYRQLSWVMRALVHIPCSVARCGKPSHYLQGIDTFCPDHRAEYEGARSHYENRWIDRATASREHTADLTADEKAQTRREKLHQTKRKKRRP